MSGSKIFSSGRIWNFFSNPLSIFWKKWVKAVNASGNLTELPSDRQHCEALFCDWEHSDKAAGGLLLTIALVVMFICLFFIVKVLNSIFSGHIAKIVNKFVNKGFPGKFQKLDFLIGYFAILVGCGMTILVQSSSIFTSTLTPLVGLNIIGIERAFPMVLGSNIGTTVTGLLAALASDKNFEQALQISMCHLLFNIIGKFLLINTTARMGLGFSREGGFTKISKLLTTIFFGSTKLIFRTILDYYKGFVMSQKFCVSDNF